MGPQMLPAPKANLAWDHPPFPRTWSEPEKGKRTLGIPDPALSTRKEPPVGPQGKGLLGTEGHDGPPPHWASSELGLSPQGPLHPFPSPRSVGPKGKGPPAASSTLCYHRWQKDQEALQWSF